MTVRCPRLLLILFFLQFFNNTNASFTAQCFTTKFDHGISSAVPIAELWQITAADCLNYCIFNSAKAGDGCAAVVFHREFGTCQLYGQDGTFNGAQIVEAKKHDYYNRTSYIGACQDRTVPKNGYQQRPRQYSVNTVKMNSAIPLIPRLPAFREQREEETIHRNEEVVGKFEEEKKLRMDGVAKEQLETLLEQEEEVENENAITFLNPTKTNVCSKREKIAYFVLFGYALSAATKPARLRGVDQSSCIMYCSQNINSTGSPNPCYAANYDPIKEQCRLYGRTAKTDRHSAKLIADENIIFADKFCIETVKDCSAESPYIVYMQKQMTVKIVAHYPAIHSIVACLGLCIDNAECRAVTYKTGGLCILHGASPAMDSSLLLSGSEQTMVIENGCQLTASAVPSLLSGSLDSMTSPVEDASSWGEWSACQFGSAGKRMRARHRECYTEQCEDLQLQPCTSE